ncbi:MAG: hypothetical protein IPJ07_08580 [Acidobacteria bacterium]|nr:hypothetical protein [Acidobacteriota bacterium]
MRIAECKFSVGETQTCEIEFQRQIFVFYRKILHTLLSTGLREFNILIGESMRKIIAIIALLVLFTVAAMADTLYLKMAAFSRGISSAMRTAFSFLKSTTATG